MEDNKEPILSSEENGVLKLKINCPEEKNGLNWKALKLLGDAYKRAIEDETIRVVVLTGNDEYFHTGGRVNADDPEESEKYSKYLEYMQTMQNRLTVPLIAAVSGDCLKGGMGFVADADFAVAKKGVRFGFPEVRMGGVPMMVMVSTIGMPKKKALEAYYSSEYFSAEEAEKMGLVNCVAEADEFWDTVQRYIDLILDKPRNLIRMTRDAYYNLVDLPSRQARESYAMETLRTKVLPEMSRTKTEHNV